MDALQGKVESIDSEIRDIGGTLRNYLETGATAARKVKPPGTKAARDLLLHLLGRLEQVSTDLGGVSSSLSPSLHGPDTPVSHGSPLPRPQDVSPELPTNQQPAPLPAPESESESSSAAADLPTPSTAGAPPATTQQLQLVSRPLSHTPPSGGLPLGTLGAARLPDPVLSDHASPLFSCTYRDVNVLNEYFFEECSRHPIVQDRGYFKLQVHDLPVLRVEKMDRPTKDHVTSFCYKADSKGMIKVDTGKRVRFSAPRLPFPRTAKSSWSFEEQRDLWNSSALNPPQGTRPYIIGNPLFEDAELSPGEKLRQRGRGPLEGINTQYVYFNLTGKTITTMHREDAHVRSENLLRSGENKFWCFVKPTSTARMEEMLRIAYPSMRNCSQAVRHLSLHIPPARLDEWGVEYTLDYCVPGQAIVTEPGTYHQVLNLGPNYAVAINVEYLSSPDQPVNYTFCDDNCPDKFAMTADDFKIWPKPPLDAPGIQQVQQQPQAQTGFVSKPVSPSPDEVSRPTLQSPAEPVALLAPPIPEKPASPELQSGSTSSLQAPMLTAEVPQMLPSNQEPELPPKERIPDVAAWLAKEQTRDPSLCTQPAETMESEPQHTQALPQQSNDRPSMPAPSPQAAPLLGFNSSTPPLALNSLGPLGEAAEALALMSSTPAPRSPPNKKRPAAPAAKKAPKRQKIEPPPPQPLYDSPATAILKRLTTLVQSTELRRVSSVASAASQLSEKTAFHRLDDMVKGWRGVLWALPEVSTFELINRVDEMALNAPIHIYLRRLSKVMLADLAVVVGDEEEARQRSYIANTNVLLEKLQWSQNDLPKLQDYIREGKCWKTICNHNDGLLCVLPPDPGILDLAMFHDEVARFHQQLNTKLMRSLGRMGKALQQAICNVREPPEFVWEDFDTSQLSAAEIEPLLLQHVTIAKKHHYNPQPTVWPCPPGWRGTIWPTDPLAVAPGERHCGMCKRKANCQCARKQIPEIPKVEIGGPRGEGVRSVGKQPAGKILGELLGEVTPVGSHPGEWTYLFRRPDMDNAAVAEIYPGRRGNWVRKVHHSDSPSAELRPVKIMGRWRAMLLTLREIEDGEEITMDRGKDCLSYASDNTPGQ
ncbi:hypothetical protein QBC47DRAFT_295393 [Echria macrotheca]|uniref:JmjC domain-containing protein n=1 Tax=Echria macrotheca TaxID=438768 RepID=A0AAJ0BI51_9PEZI|nr:hypothetical protein QBC47DRAFT_295393 [Echria macrotheca]